ncbi:hypothetical protein NPIL_584211 [Nephila pilipes]|uniref:Transposase n=1 Tax=Nephila pilipes TaxID=299642 RepID=A0A8X6MMZ0_NEPPI|nr:hypothetical protein NPIL_584211 [Nephila pilipes]
MNLMYGRAYSNGCLAQWMYQQQYLKRRCSYCSTFATKDRILRGKGNFLSARPDAGRPNNVHTFQIEQTVLLRLTSSPTTSTLAVADELDVSHSMAWNVLHTATQYPFHVQKVQLITEDDYPRRE